MDKFMENFLGYKEFGPAIDRRDVPAEKIEKFRGKLPNILLDYWQEYGWCGYGKGLLWTVDPDEWEDELEAWIGETQFMEHDAYYVIARTAFGGLILWGENTGQSLKVTTPYGMIFPSFDEEEYREDGPDLTIQLFFSTASKEMFDLLDSEKAPLFERALEKLGPLDHTTMYGFVPALALGGTPALERLQKLDAHIHLDILSQVTELQVMRDIAQDARDAGLL
ncbi:glutamyl-tRNA amidotransferase (plasmid) [Burkholderia sp. JP2-270]|uniref:GAD-like domain-containing protein n=1 Tax=Burkholderia sp. JP2-270 TaxID=2217913 RepID=UPI000DA3F354|nr:GAD-like domain-containing protein [Burkholderia sp. JP2-270]AWV05429.1 glutamyl-tRNA amidotransferase [Burkholderia sp. JP2-270]